MIISEFAEEILRAKPQDPICRFKFPGSPGSPGGGGYDETMLLENPFINSSQEFTEGAQECTEGAPELPKNIFGKGSCYSEAIPIEEEEEVTEEVTETKKRKRFGDQEEEEVKEVIKTTKRRKKTVFLDCERRTQPQRNTFKCNECSRVVTTMWREYNMDNGKFIHRLCDGCNELQREYFKKMKM